MEWPRLKHRKDLDNNTQRLREDFVDSKTNQTLLDLIASKGLKQAQFSRLIVRDKALLNRIIHGKDKPTRETMILIAKELGVDSRVIWP